MSTWKHTVPHAISTHILTRFYITFSHGSSPSRAVLKWELKYRTGEEYKRSANLINQQKAFVWWTNSFSCHPRRVICLISLSVWWRQMKWGLRMPPACQIGPINSSTVRFHKLSQLETQIRTVVLPPNDTETNNNIFWHAVLMMCFASTLTEASFFFFFNVSWIGFELIFSFFSEEKK